MKTDYEVQVEPPDGEWRAVKHKQHDRDHGIVLFTFYDGTQLRVGSFDKIMARRVAPATADDTAQEGTDEE